MEVYLQQIEKILPAGTFEVRYNSEWFESMKFAEVLSLASRATVQQMLARDMFQQRLADEKPIHVHEFLYPLMQGYDSVKLQADGEVGGNDQVFNMLIGRDLEKQILGKDKLVFGTRLIIDPKTGKKMGKTEGASVVLSDPPTLMFEKLAKSTPDNMQKTLFELCTPMAYLDIDAQHEVLKTNQRAYTLELAFQVVKIFYGSKKATEARNDYEIIAEGGVPENIKEVEADGLPLDRTLVVSGAASSMMAAHRLINEGATGINGEVSTNWKQVVKSEDKIKVGKGKFIKVK
jgi:tyrosyl-tRNA synthetase